MDIRTKYGLAKDIKIEPYGNDTFALSYIKENIDDVYVLFGMDAPCKGDEVYRFWIEFGADDGSAETVNAEITEEDKQKLISKFENEWKRERNSYVRAS